MNRIELLKKYLGSSPDDCFLQHALALEYVKEGNDKEAEKLFMQVLDRDPLYLGSYYHMGKLLERKGNTASAKAIYKKGMEAAMHAEDRHTGNELQAALEDLEENEE